ncbi:hypothetical protein ILYODFUR_038849 [Ilyodon furcidens]|uniref:Secreted protein n=1 Tax=Ilyodon furcidens TaxID=33524 RepID=A0ABV0VKP6_9TELE
MQTLFTYMLKITSSGGGIVLLCLTRTVEQFVPLTLAAADEGRQHHYRHVEHPRCHCDTLTIQTRLEKSTSMSKERCINLNLSSPDFLWFYVNKIQDYLFYLLKEIQDKL